MNIYMDKLSKAGSLELEDMAYVASVEKSNSEQLIRDIGKVVDMNLWDSCKVESVNHYTALKTIIDSTTSRVSTTIGESPNESLKATNEPQELKFFSYDQLKKQATEAEGIYRGKLYGTIQRNNCPEKMDCPSCGGNGICKECEGEKHVVCPVCNGDKECIACHGTGTYTCKNCEGSGECPECDNGWIECDDCDGSGEVDCWDCDGTGTYYDNRHPNGVTCRSCKGSGKHRCSNCYGKGGWSCGECDGSGYCSHCGGDGGFPCKACGATGKCGKCRGKGKIWCPECHGKGICFDCKGEKLVTCSRCNGSGVYQSYTEYTFEEKTVHEAFFTLPLAEENIKDITGDQVYNGVLYKFFAGHAEIYDLDNALASLKDNHIQDFKEWVSIERLSRISKNIINDDYLNTTIANILVPVTQVRLICRKRPYNIWVMGKNKFVFYDKLPGKLRRFFGRIFGK